MSRLNYKEYQKLIGDRIKQYRVNAGISQKDLENESGSVRSQHIQIRAGEHRFNLRV